MKQEEVIEICKIHNVDPVGAELFNSDWIISRTGDLIGGPNWGYGIYDNNHLDNWITHIAEKTWGNPYTFIPAYVESLCRQGYESYLCRVSFRCEKQEIKPFELRGKEDVLIRMADEVVSSKRLVYGRD